MIRILTVQNTVATIKVIRAAFPAYSIGEAKRLLDALPCELPHMYSWNEEHLRKALSEIGCEFEATCRVCLGDDPQKCTACYERFVHSAHSFPSSYDGPVCGSMYFYTSCGANWSELCVERPPTVHEGLSGVELKEIVDNLTCPRCCESLTNWGYIQGASHA